jgi:hypothetical protein
MSNVDVKRIIWTLDVGYRYWTFGSSFLIPHFSVFHFFFPASSSLPPLCLLFGTSELIYGIRFNSGSIDRFVRKKLRSAGGQLLGHWMIKKGDC